MSASLANATPCLWFAVARAHRSAGRRDDVARFRGCCSPSTLTKLVLSNARRIRTHATSDDAPEADLNATANAKDAQVWIDNWKNTQGDADVGDVVDDVLEVLAEVDEVLEVLVDDAQEVLEVLEEVLEEVPEVLPEALDALLEVPGALLEALVADADADDLVSDEDADAVVSQDSTDEIGITSDDVVSDSDADDASNEPTDEKNDTSYADPVLAAAAALESSLDATAMDALIENATSREETEKSWLNSSATDIKSNVLNAVSCTQRGVADSGQTKRAEINELVVALEAMNRIEAPADFFDINNKTPLRGDWRLLYTDDRRTLLVLAANGLPGVSVGEMRQTLSSSSSNKDAIICVTKINFQAPLIETSSFVTASLVQVSPKRLSASVTETGVCDTKIVDSVSQYIGVPMSIDVLGNSLETPEEIGAAVDQFRQNVQGVLQGALDSATGVVNADGNKIALPVPDNFPGAKSWILTTYVDDTARVARGEGGAVYVFERV